MPEQILYGIFLVAGLICFAIYERSGEEKPEPKNKETDYSKIRQHIKEKKEQHESQVVEWTNVDYSDRK